MGHDYTYQSQPIPNILVGPLAHINMRQIADLSVPGLMLVGLGIFVLGMAVKSRFGVALMIGGGLCMLVSDTAALIYSYESRPRTTEDSINN